MAYPLPVPPPADVRPAPLFVPHIASAASALESLTPEATEVLPEWLAAYKKRNRAPRWIGDVEPIPLDAWCEELDGCQLTTRQRWVFEQSNMIRAADVFSSRRTVQEMVLVWGKGSGKGYTIAKLFSWLAYVLSSMADDPAEWFDLASETGLVMINVAPNEDLARNVFFKYLKRFLRHPRIARFSPDVLADDARFYRQGRHGRYEFLSIYSRHSNASGLDGHNLIAFAGDEVDAFEKTDTVCRATEIHDILRSSASTRVKRGWIGAMFSYPRTVDGFMMKLYDRAIKDMTANGPRATFFADRAATWDVRPDVSRDTPTIADDYRNDPKGAAARYECLPMEVEEGFIEFTEYVDEAIAWNHAPAASWREVLGEMTTAQGTRPCIRVELGDVRPEPGRTYYMGGDGGLTGDSFAISIFSTPASGSGGDSIRWICPMCAQTDPDMLRGERWDRQQKGSYWRAESMEDAPVCELCGGLPSTEKTITPTFVEWWVRDWYRYGNVARDKSGGTGVDGLTDDQAGNLDVEGRTIVVPRVREELIITWDPKRRMRTNERNVAVDLVNVEDILRELIERLRIKKFDCDPYQMVSMAQRLQGHAGCVTECVSYGTEPQFSRGRTTKALLYAGLIQLLPHASPQQGDSWSYDYQAGEWGHTGARKRDTEWKKLQRKNRKLDHPKPHGSKDIWDAETAAICAAVTDWVGDITILFAE